MAAPHAVTNHGNAAEEKLRRIGCLDGKQRIRRGFLNRVQRAELGMGVMKPISKVKTPKKPTTIGSNSSTAGVSYLEPANVEGGRADSGVDGHMHDV